MVTNKRKPLTVYKASAGSGKTFTLATEYIRLLIENPQSYRTILAVTFTNKATEEMKTRIISQLYGIWKQLPDSDKYMDAVQKSTGFGTKMISERAGIALNNLIHNYNYFQVQTIDTFFQSVLRNMARELDLTTNLRIGLNDTQVEEMAVDQMIEDLSTTDIVLQWIMKYILESISDDKSWNVISQIKKFGRTIFRDEYKEVSDDLEKKLAEPGFFDNYTAQLREIRQQTEDRMKEIGESFFDTLEGEGLTVDDLAKKSRGIAGFFIKLRKGIFDPSIENATVANCLDNPEGWCTKSHPQHDYIVSLAETSLGKILRYAVEERPRQWRLYKSADLTLRHLSQLRLLSSIERKVHEINENANRFLLSNTQQLLHSLIDSSDSPFIFEKIGTQLHHVMIDEFQDTSTVQWKNFKVLLADVISHEEDGSLIVGDVKQSIYRWRSGDWRLLNGIEQQFSKQQMEVKSLSTNYRSERNIITFNNTFFQHAVELEYLEQSDLSKTEAEELRKAYADVRQQVPDHRQDNGYVHVELLPADDYQQQTLQRLTTTVSELQSQGVSLRDIAILVRSNAHIPLIARYFMEEMPEVTIVSDEAFRLDASCAVRLLIHALRLLVHPDDILTKAAIVKSYQSDILQTTAHDQELLLATNDLDKLLPEAYIQHTDELLAMPIYDLVETLFTIFGLERLEAQSAYVHTFYDSLTDYIEENTTDIEAFLAEWDETICGKTIQSDETDGVRILSIHKSKGLEYGYVILPFCDWQMEKQGVNILWCRPSEAPFSDLPIAPIDYSQKQMVGTIYEGDYVHEHLQNTVDNLNLLYVAFTRSRRGLYVIGKRDDVKNSRCSLIQQCLPLVTQDMSEASLEGVDDKQQSIVFSYGALGAPEKSDDHDAPSPNPFLQSPSPIPIGMKSFRRKVSFRQSNRSKIFMEGHDGEDAQQMSFIQTGSVLHEVFSTIRTTADIPDALQRLQAEGVLYDDHITAEKIGEMIKKRLSDPRVTEWFSPRWTLFNECTILTTEDGQVKERRPDRVMTDGQRWVVVDFKFGSPKPDYPDQVREYMSLLASMGHQHISGYLWYVYSNKIEEVK